MVSNEDNFPVPTPVGGASATAEVTGLPASTAVGGSTVGAAGPDNSQATTNSSPDNSTLDISEANDAAAAAAAQPHQHQQLPSHQLLQAVKQQRNGHSRNPSTCTGGFSAIEMEPDNKLLADNSCLTAGHDSTTAIKLAGARKHYGRGKKKLQVLMGLDMEVERGTIYGLLGPSGCGKTTLLKTIVGKLKVDQGSVEVFGEPPGTPGSGVPGARVGYMPQELALFGEFNIAETLRYFSRLYGMSYQKYKERIDFLMKFLDLPSRTRQLQRMSGGQQRRASLAVALIHEPELLILDEPTVGVDPLLRTSIWSHLLDLSSAKSRTASETKLASTNCIDGGGVGGDGMPFFGTTIVITTHYIEEARQATRVGMMRFGKLLAQDSPEALLQRYEKPNLEDVFLELCLQDGDLETTAVREDRADRPSIFKKANNNSSSQGQGQGRSGGQPLLSETGKKNKVQLIKSNNKKSSNCSKMSTSTPPTANEADIRPPQVKVKQPNSSGRTICNMNTTKVHACMLKTFNRMKKRIGFLIYQFVLPAIQVSLFCMAIGQDPKELPVAVVNQELPGGAMCRNDSYTYECPAQLDGFFGIEMNEHGQNLTCRYMSFIDRSVANLVHYEDYGSAKQAVENGEAWGVVHFGETFSKDLFSRAIEMTATSADDVNTDVINGSTIRVNMDVTNQHIAFTLQLKFVEAFEAFMKQLVTSCKLPDAMASIPLVFDTPIYGNNELTFTDFMAPGIILTIVHSMALGYSAMIIIIERNEGLLDRTWVAGVTPGEFALAHFIVSLVVNLLQVIVTLVFMILVFQVPAEGSVVWIFLLTMLQGICGTTIGLIISAVCETQQDATQIALGIFYPNLILSGIIWPVESMPVALRYFSYILPQTFACEAMRGILLRGWGITYMPVWRGYLVTLAWIVGTYAIFKRLVMKEG